MHIKRTLAFVLKIVPFKERDQIVTFFTQSFGIQKIYVKQNKTSLPIQPIQELEIVFKERSHHLHTAVDYHLINPFLKIRQKYLHLNIAGKMIRYLLLQQWEGIQNGLLYQLFLAYIKQIEQFANPNVLLLSFYCKIQIHEGSFWLSKECILCHKQPATTLEEGKSVCQFCQTLPQPYHFSRAEWEHLMTLANARSFSLLTTVENEIELIDKGLCLLEKM